MSIKGLIPAKVRRELQHTKRIINNLLSGTYWKIARPCSHGLTESVLSIEQPIKGSSFVENKISNIRLSASLVEQITIHPKELFSFWRAVGRPSEKRGFKKGRTLSSGEVVPDIGGGLCQLSGIIYHASLLAGLTIVERHNHSVDLYKESERFTPLGSDATVAYGYKDLMFQNITESSLAFQFTITDKSITCEILAEKKIPLRTVRFDRVEEDHHISVSSIDTQSGRELAQSVYKKLS